MYYNFVLKFFLIPRAFKSALQVVSDAAMIVLCFWLSMALRLDGISTSISASTWLTLSAVIPAALICFSWLGLYNTVVRYITERTLVIILAGCASSAIVMLVFSQSLDLAVPRSVPGIYFALSILSLSALRIAIKTVHHTSNNKHRTPVIIYGAGTAGRLLMQSLKEDLDYELTLFIDDDPELQGTRLGKYPVVSLSDAKKHLELLDVRIALIAISDENPNLQRAAVNSMIDLGLDVRFIPRVADIISGRAPISGLRKVNIEDLLGRDVVKPITPLLRQTTTGKSILVSGAGGSIGSELCRQILKQGPHRLVLLDISEYALYNILEELQGVIKNYSGSIDLVPVVGSATNRDLLDRVLRTNNVSTFFHAAAYKHVPLLETNALEAIKNNSLGTHVAACAAGNAGVKNFTLISTDKAVRPSNVMGASKRLAELSMQAAARIHLNTKFCAVRFGNVLGSSGSVVPKFEKQIRSGGPITVTHRDITRFFMTIPEAAQLVIQASSMATSGEIYLLDMGTPVRIVDLARTVSKLHGKQTFYTGDVKPSPNAVEITFTGLRPGEKLYEELLVDGTETKTSHPQIMCELSRRNIELDIPETLERLVNLRNPDELKKILETLPIDYRTLNEEVKEH